MQPVNNVTVTPAAQAEHPHNFISSIISAENEAVIGRVLKQLDTWGEPIAGIAQAIPIINTAYAAYEAIILARMTIDELRKHGPGAEQAVVAEWHKLRYDRSDAAVKAGLAVPTGVAVPLPAPSSPKAIAHVAEVPDVPALTASFDGVFHLDHDDLGKDKA